MHCGIGKRMQHWQNGINRECALKCIKEPFAFLSYTATPEIFKGLCMCICE